MIWEILLILVLILANGLFAAAEIAFIAARKGRLEQRAEEGNRKARRALELARNPDLFLPIAQIGMTLVGSLAAAYGGHEIVQEIGKFFSQSSWPIVVKHADGLALGLFVVCYTYLTLILGELVPKRASLHRAETLAIFLAPIMHVISVVARPFVWLLGISSSMVLWVLRLEAGSEPSVSLDDIEHLIESGTAEGVV